MSRGGGPWTEFPRETAFRGTSVRSAKTAPATPFMVRDASSDSIVCTFLGQSESLEWAASPSLAGDHLAGNTALDLTVLEDLESDLSSASGLSASASLASTPSLEPISDSIVLPSTLPESHRNTTYASRMHMSQFQQEQSRFKWDSFVQRIKEGLPEKVVHQNKFFQLIDYGGSGSVHATAFKMHRDCDTLAIKVLRNKKVDTNIDLPNEFQIMRGLKHNHIVAFVGTFSRKGQFAVLMYPVAICNLAEYLKDASESNLPRNRREPRQWKTLLTAFGCLSSAVRYLHTSRKIKHKDIKPENILVDRYGSVLLADFGISKQYEDDTLTEGTTPFTDKYAPPEVVDQDKRGLSSDIFSLGCVFLEMATVTLGESLENLSRAVFDTRNRQSYRDSPSRVSNWISQLKRVAILEAHSSYSAGSQNPSDSDHIIDNQNLTTQHLDAVLSMMSRSPTDRPSITAVYELFKGFANQCLECQGTGVCSDSTGLCTTRLIQRQDARLERSCSHKPSSKIQVLPAALTEARAVIDQSQPGFQAIARQGSTRDNFGWGDGGYGYPSSLETLKAQPPMAIDETENDYSSEAESFYSDSDTADDRNPGSDAESERRIAQLKSMIQPLLDKKRALILSFLRNIDGATGAFRYCPADGSSGSRRQGSPINGPPGKRRSVENRKALPLPDEDGNGGSDGEEDPGERHDRNKDPKFNGSSRPRMLACPFHQRDRNRFTNRACQWPGWAEFHRLKEHLFRVHRIYRCPRCQEAFPQKSGLNSHQRQATACNLLDRVFDDAYDWGQGFDDEQCSNLKSRLRNVDEEEKWRRCYRILFPRDAEADMPSPYCTDGRAERITGLTNHISRGISRMLPRDLGPELQRAIHASIEELAHQYQLGRDRNVAQVNSPRGPSLMQQPSPEYTRMALELDQIPEADHSAFSVEFPASDHYRNEETTAAFQTSNPATATTDSACFTDTLANGSSGYLSTYMGPLPNDFPWYPDLRWSLNQGAEVPLNDFQSYSGAGDMMYEGSEEAHDR